MQEMQVQSLGQEDSLEREMATSSNVLAWKISWTEDTGGLESKESHGVRYNWVTEHARPGKQRQRQSLQANISTLFREEIQSRKSRVRGKEKERKIQCGTWPSCYSLQTSTKLLQPPNKHRCFPFLQGMFPDKMLETLCDETVVIGK